MPLNPKAKLARDVFNPKKIERVPTRNGYGEGLVECGDKNENVVALCADLTESTRTEAFAKKYPKRFIEMGVAEQNLVTVAAGLAAVGKIPFIASYAMFSPGRAWEQVRTTICYNDVPVKIVGAHAGVSVGPDGATHQAIEDMAIMRTIPNMTVLAPGDVNEARKSTLAGIKIKGPTYTRYTREKTPVFTTKATPFKIGLAEILFNSKNKPDVALIACGPLVYEALLAAHELETKHKIKVRVINNHTIKPIDEKTIIKAARDAGAIVTIEEHQIMGGMGSAVAEVLVQNYPVPQEFIGIQDRFGESGTPDELLKKFGLTAPYIVKSVKRILKRKS